MTPADKPAFLAVLVGLSSIKPGKPLTDEGLDLYWMALQDWRLDDFKAAAGQLAKSAEFMPNPYHFEQLRKAGRMTSGEAFEMARESVKFSMPSEWPSLSSGNGTVDRAIRGCGGYQALAACTTENIGFFERRFAEHYESGSDAEDTRQALPFLDKPRSLDGPRKMIGAA